MSTYQTAIDAIRELKAKFGNTWRDISAEDAARMQMQNQFKTGLDIAKYTAAIMRRDMAAYDADSSKYTQSLGCWHGLSRNKK
jgi:isocitrate lyase